MKKVTVLLVVFFALQLFAQDAIINEMSQGSDGNKEWVEILVITDGLDMRGWELGDNDDGTWHSIAEFTTSSDWANVQMGTIIVIYNDGDIDGQITAAGGEDTDFADKKVIIGITNSTYVTDTGGWPGSGVFGNSDRDDCAVIRDASDVIVHDMSVTHGTATVGSPASGNVKYFTSNSAGAALLDGNWTEAASTNGTPGEPNGGDNTIWIDQTLPVELTSFTANAADGKVTLKWTTASELNNQGFAILRSQEKEAEYQQMDSYELNDDLNGAGNSSKQINYSWTDETVMNGTTYWYKLVDVDVDGIRTEHGPITAKPYAIETPGEESVPTDFYLTNYPNPFNPETRIVFDLSSFKQNDIAVSLTVYNALGEKVKTLLNNTVLSNTSHDVVWNGTNDQGVAVPSGVYFYTFKSSLKQVSKKMLLVR